MHDITFIIAAIGFAGIAAQWLAWRFRLPGIVLLLAAGLVAGPLTGFLNPAEDFGDIYRPLISVAVAIILFEGGLTLNFNEIRETSRTVRQIILISGPLVWAMGTVAAHFIGGLSWQTSLVLGAIFVVTGPTVIMPLLRQAQLASRPASILRWEAIVNDPIGALFAVLAFEGILVAFGYHQAENLLLHIATAFIFATIGGYLISKAIEWSFLGGHVPEFLKAPVLLAIVLSAYALTNLMLEEAGLLTVTVMGITLANSKIASLAEMRRFKETITTLLVSGVFILLTASLQISDIMQLDMKVALFVVALLFVIRPLAIFIGTIGSGATIQERILTGWIAPRGVVAVAVSGLFASTLTDIGVADAGQMVPFTFAVVVSTILLHGFTLGPLAKILNLKSTTKPGVLIVGGSRWSTALAKELTSNDVPVTISDDNWNHLIDARLSGIDVFYGEILSEHGHHNIESSKYSMLITASDNDANNALVSTDFGPELGRSNVFQLPDNIDKSERQMLNFTLGGRSFLDQGLSYDELRDRQAQGWQFQTTELTDQSDWNDYLTNQSNMSVTILSIKPNGKITVYVDSQNKPSVCDKIISYALPERVTVPNTAENEQK